MQKISAMTAMLTVACLLTACGNSNEVPDGSQSTETTTSTITELPSDEATQETAVDLSAMVDEVTSNVEWASLLQIEDDDVISEFFTLDANNPNYQQLLVMQCPMSAVIAEIIIIQAYDVDSAMDDLNARREKLINTDAYYPEHKEIAEASIIDHVGDIVYFIAGENAEESETVLVDYINRLG